MSKPIITVENLSKKYSIGDKQNFYTLRDTISGIFSSKKEKEEFLALKDINFQIKPGESVGIIGRNGAGKSTLLKILSQITPPTTGKITMRGRVASLLEVGTGFHQELTGRENIFLNGAILGMTRDEVKRKFDEIVAFSEVEKFLDMPVKHYSSGMYMRLAFAVAAHLESEILIVDEVLAVGDAQFQKKCLGKMDEVTRKEGRTVLFVSHNMDVIRSLCNKSILLDNGNLVYFGDVNTSYEKYNYLQRESQITINHGSNTSTRRGSGTLSFTMIEIADTKSKKRNVFKNDEIARFNLSYKILKDLMGLNVSIAFFSSSNSGLLLTNLRHEIASGMVKKNVEGSVCIEVNLSVFRPGEYNLYFWLGDRAAIYQDSPVNFDVIDNLTQPLIIVPDKNDEKMKGYFKLESKIKIL